MEEYFENLLENVKREYEIAEPARAKGYDPVSNVEVPLAISLAEKAIGLISTIYPQLNETRAVIDRILELEKEYGQLDAAVSFKIAEEVASEKFCKFENQIQAIDAGIRVGFAYVTLGVVSSPIEGFTGLKIKKTKDGKDYFSAYFSGPIRSAGTTASCVVLMIIDYLREYFGYAKYDPDEKEIKRYVTENYDYHERVTNLQYIGTPEEIEFLASHMPIEIDGEPTEDREVSNYKDLPRVSTNLIRGGMALIFSEGLSQKAQKGMRLLKGVQQKGFKATGWNFLDDYVILHKKREKGTTDTSPTYIKDLVAGRPVFGHPSTSGGFRFRYGRSRVSGFSATSVHPATMAISNNFLSSGTQLKVEKPTKGCVVTSCDSLSGPIIRLKDGSVKKIKTFEEAKKLYKETEQIIYLGDILFSLGDVMNRNYELIKPGYVEEWWFLELKKKIEDLNKGKEVKIEIKEVYNKNNFDLNKAKEISIKYGIPLHPEYIFFWTQINKEQFIELLKWFKISAVRDGKLILPYETLNRKNLIQAKTALEILGVEHFISTADAVINEENTEAFFTNLNISEENFKERINEILNLLEKEENKEKSLLEIINTFSKFRIKDLAGTFIGARMGRPEKAKARKLIGSPSVLFPIGEQGGRFRSVNEAANIGFIKADFPTNYCQNCKKETIYGICESCFKKTTPIGFCLECNKKILGAICGEHGKCKPYFTKEIDGRYYFEKAIEKLNLSKDEIPKLIKGVKGTSNQEHAFENLAKGILRSKNGLCVNKDGTIRYDATEIPVTHFKPKEIGATIDQLKEMGYKIDIENKELINDDQILELFPHDIILPSCPDSSDEKADEFFFNIANFIDELLEKFYHLPRYYNLKSKKDLIGKLAACMAPHNCAGVVARIIGFSKTQGIMASPFMHAAVRRDCDGDEIAVMLLLDVLLNFSRKFLPSHRGGTQDAPLVLNARIKAGEVDDQILDLELVENYPLELYELAEQGKHSSEVKIENVKKRLRENKNPFINLNFTHNTHDFNDGIINSSYKSLPSMKEKVDKQMEVVTKLRSVNSEDVARLIIERHFIRDIKGNFNKFTQQRFRCVNCNEKYRRPPLSGKCNKCKDGRIIFTISEGSIIKYLIPALELSEKYNLSPYIKQSLDLIKEAIESMFGKEAEKQQDLKKWFG